MLKSRRAVPFLIFLESTLRKAHKGFSTTDVVVLHAVPQHQVADKAVCLQGSPTGHDFYCPPAWQGGITNGQYAVHGSVPS